MNKDRLGFYLVGWKKFYNKTLALLESQKTNYDPIWIFNDSVYSSYNWTIPITTTLANLYAQRAKQLREKYDYIILYYSGGGDSENMLKAFIDNNIFIDEIALMVIPPDRKNLKDMDTSPRNLYAEIDFIAIPNLKKIENRLNPKTKITFQDCATPVIELLQQDDWWEKHTPGSGMTLGNLARQFYPLQEGNILDIFHSDKKTCQLYGVDKPLVWYNDNNYYAFFADNNAYHIGSIELNYTKEWNKNFVTEYFYWTPDFPEIVIKQAQEIVAHCKADVKKQELWSKSFKKNVGEYRDVMHPIIYPEIENPKFQVKKTRPGMDREGLDDWFWETAPIKVQKNYTEVFDFLNEKINQKFVIEGNFKNGLATINSRMYRL